MQAQATSRKRLVKEAEKQIRLYDDRIYAVQKEINRQQAALDTLEAHYSRLVMGAYKNRDVKIWYMYILSSDNLAQAFRRFGYFKSLASQIKHQAEKIDILQTELNGKKANLLDLKHKAQLVKNERTAELERIQKDEKEQAKLVASLKKNTKAYKASLKAKQDEMKALDKQISKMIAEAGRKKNKKPVDMTLADSFTKNKGKLPWPVDGPVTEHFGPYQNKTLRLSLFNNGITIACAESAPVKAVFDGVVSDVMLAPGYGQCILIQHGDYYTSYCKVKNCFVHKGDKVKTGQIIAEVSTIMGKTQLYFLLYRKKYIDPEVWLYER